MLYTCGGNSEPGILVVDDHPGICLFIRAALEEFGFRVWTAHSGPDALRLLANAAVQLQLLITDLQMPHMTGSALADAVLRQRPGTPVLFMSGSDGRGSIPVEGLFLSKPFSVRDLLNCVGTLAAPGLLR